MKFNDTLLKSSRIALTLPFCNIEEMKPDGMDPIKLDFWRQHEHFAFGIFSIFKQYVSIA